MNKALGLMASVCTLAGSLALAAPGTAAAAGPPDGGISWAVAPAMPGRLYSVTAISDSDVWAAGLNGGRSLIVHWNGRTWSQSQPTGGYLTGVAASSASDVWAVGGTNWFSPTQTLAEHWNGSSWQRVATPNPAGGGDLNSVTATSPSNAWAVGHAGPGPGGGLPSPTTPLIEHWNGRAWTIQGIQVPAGGSELVRVAALSPSNAWVVGWTGQGTGQRTLIEHWNGKTWTRVPTPNEGRAGGLNAVTVISANNAWAVGNYTAADGTSKTMTLYWDGRTWTLVPSVTPGGDDEFLGVTASWTHNIWAVGGTNPTRCGHGPKCQTLVEHWNSVHHTWRVLSSPNPLSSYLNMLFSVSAVSRGDIWAVGTTDYASTLIVHWNGTSWS